MEHLTRHINVPIDVGIKGLRSKLGSGKRIMEGGKEAMMSSQMVTESQATSQRLEELANETKLRLDTLTDGVVGIHLMSNTDVTELLRPLLPIPALSEYVNQLAHDGVRNPVHALELAAALCHYHWLPLSYQFKPVVRYPPLILASGSMHGGLSTIRRNNSGNISTYLGMRKTERSCSTLKR